MAGTTSGRGRYRLLLLLVTATLLVVWFFTPTQDEPTAGSPSPVPSATSTDDETGFPPTHQLTETNTPSTEPTASSGTDPDSGLPYVDEASLPAEARDVLARIDAGGPFKYPDDDGKTFENREELLPDQPIGYYREYTVESAPRVRGPRRIVTGEGDEYYWTDDHYDSFSRIQR